ncbi:hypothetical protein DJ83_11135 [Halorubrum ezzemoulense]|uniref:Uncharacterized protein n=1 Tax=Halorubrum ezzemoulense TaxID=337243 RepID=A0A256ITF8_HALEZ|nr:hypothetical protein [Halorubrum ezzemoulense]OYR59839.1 hypothetical protein DJ83_11135 [Halorubrum ezzemoulense]
MRAIARLDDPVLAEAFEEAADEYGSKSIAVRVALKKTYVAGEDMESAVDEAEPAHDLTHRQVEAWGELREWAGVGEWIELEAAESLLANKLNIPAESVRKTLIKPLKKEGAVGVSQRNRSVDLIVGKLPTQEATTGRATTSSDAGRVTNEAVATDGGATMSELEAAETEGDNE